LDIKNNLSKSMVACGKRIIDFLGMLIQQQQHQQKEENECNNIWFFEL
jgi:hypothetical protein